MNLLIDDLPEYVEIGGKAVKINTDFRAGLRVILAFEDQQLTGYEKAMVMLNNLYRVIPDDAEAATRQAQKFLNGGKENGEEKEEVQVRLYSFAKDQNFIFAAFRQTHQIDLETARLHWWKFLALFMDLGAETTFCNLVGLRKRISDGTATPEEKKTADAMGELVDLDDEQDEELTPEQKAREAEFMRQLNRGK